MKKFHSAFVFYYMNIRTYKRAHTYRYCVFGAHSYALSPGVKCIRCVSNASSIKLIQIFICWCIKCVCPTEQAIALRRLGTLGRQYNKREYKNISLHKWAIFFRFFFSVWTPFTVLLCSLCLSIHISVFLFLSFYFFSSLFILHSVCIFA